MFSLKAKNIYEVARPLLNLSRYFGINAFTIEVKNERVTARVSWIDLTLILSANFNIIFSSICFLHVFSDLTKLDDMFYSKIYEKTFKCSYVFAFITSFVISWWTFSKRNSLIDLFNKLIEADAELENMKVPVNLKKVKKCILMFIFLGGFVISIAFVIYLPKIIAEDIHWIHHFGMISAQATTFQIFLTFLQFQFIVHSIKARYVCLNRFLTDNFLKSSNNVYVGKAADLHKVTCIHESLVECSDLVNKFYGVPAMLLMAQEFCYTITCIFVNIQFMYQNDSTFTFVSIPSLFWSANSTFILFIMTYWGHVARQEAMKTASLIHKIANRDKLNVLSPKILILSQQLLHRIPLFSCGLFDFDLNLTFKMIGTAAIYVVILIQFDHAQIDMDDIEAKNVTLI
ncbi:CLUMA_CG018794, isoform A [Clunio marinus]|uniref:Gustatory receptor n=1 Tax=Clunio marinus TaxID=568069 RepID=A0A1J1J2U3_9DIPT|nr:CLUMA_CG018794, isoform A [Clunio marinus]